MNKDFLERISQLSPKKLALLAMELQSKLESSQNSRSEPIAIVGIGCRFPGGANSPDAYWKMLCEGVDAITEIPKSRWDVDQYYDPDPETPGKMATRWGGFLEGVDQFDPQFFGISPREAISMDPQQRLLLEVAWEALEHAGYSPEDLSGSPTGVFVGICNNDYSQLLLSGETSNIDAYLATGSAFSIASGRISYVLGLQGPSLSVDTACSSSLVATHLAIQSLRNKECQMALAAGVNLILRPEVTITLSQSKMMASDGRCKAFDARADGFVRSEGCGVIVLKLLSHAIADGDNILAVIRGSAMNQDGRSNGITAPNGPSQEAVIQAALADAQVRSDEVGYVETHGTGTSLGDPIEVQALGNVLGAGHSADDPLMIGSVKTNLGHLESAAGVAGLIKLVLALHHQEIPPHLHLHEPNPHIAWKNYPLAIPTKRTPWTSRNGRLVGGLSSFGFSGTNVHIILENVQAPDPIQSPIERPAQIFTLSAKTEPALHDLAARFERYLESKPSTSLADVCYTTNVGRSHSKHRLAIVAGDLSQVRQELIKFGAGEKSRNASYGHLQGTRPPEVVFMFSGQGAQYVDMGRQLYETQPTFRRVLDECDRLLDSSLGQSLLSILYPEPNAVSPIDDIAIAQPALFAFQYALAQLWQSWGIQPAAVMGHSAGEYAAACVAGIFSLEDGLKLSSARGRLMKSTLPGTMVNVFTSRARVEAAVSRYVEKVSVAAINGPENIVISGETAAVELVANELSAEGLKVRSLNISIAGHSPLMDSIQDEFRKVAAEVTYSAPSIEFYSGATGQLVRGQDMNANYWSSHLRETVRFHQMMINLAEQGYRAFVEIGPEPVLTSMGQQCLPADVNKNAVWVSSLRRKNQDWHQLLGGLGALYSHGVSVDWKGFERDYVASRRRAPLPTYPFQRDSYWVKTAKVSQHVDHSLHPLLGVQLRSPAIQDIVFESKMSADWPAFLEHHRIYGVVILPSPAYIEMALKGAIEAFGDHSYCIRDLNIHQALALPEEGYRTVQLILTRGDDTGNASFRVLSLAADQTTWILHATGHVESEAITEKKVPFDVEEIRARCLDQISGEEYYGQVHELGLEFGSSFRGLTDIWKGKGEALGLVQLPVTLTKDASLYQMHPAFLDACFHLLGAPLGNIEIAYLLIGIDRLQFYRRPSTRLWNHTVVRQPNNGNDAAVTGDIRLFDETGALVAEIEGLHLIRAEREALLRSVQELPKDWFYRVDWQPKPLPIRTPSSPSDAFRFSLDELADQIADSIPQLNDRHNLREYRRFFLDLDRLSSAYIITALKKLGWEFRLGERFSTIDLVDRLGVVEQTHLRRLMERILMILSEEGILARGDSDWETIEIPEATDPQVVSDRLSVNYPAFDAELSLISQCGPQLADVLCGKQNALDVLFPAGSLTNVERVYQDASFAQAYNSLTAQMVEEILSHFPGDRKVRILEIGAGTGGTTTSILPHLDPSRTEYLFTDLSPHFTFKASNKFEAYSFVSYKSLNIEQDPNSQGFENQQFDLIVAANVLHATADLRQALTHVKQLLKSDGFLVLLEGTGPQRWVDLTFGLTEGWWRFTDVALRSSYPLISRERWRTLLTEMGFAQTAVLPTEAHPMLDQALLVSQNSSAENTPEEVIPWLIFADNAGLAQHLGGLLTARGESFVVVSPGKEYKALSENQWQLNPASPHDFERLLKETAGKFRNIIHLWSVEKSSGELNSQLLESIHSLTCGGVLHLVQALIRLDGKERPKLWLVTEGAQAVGASQFSAASLEQIPLWGFGRVIALEHPELWGGLIDLDPTCTPGENASRLLSEVLQADGEDQVAWRAEERLVARLIRTNPPNASDRGIRLKKDGVYLITGGLGGLGLKVAKWLAEQGARHLVLVGRHGLPENKNGAVESDDSIREQIAAVQAIRALGTTVDVEAADVSDMTRMAELIQSFGTSRPPLRGILHAAADLSDWKIKDMPLEALQSMLKPKVTGTWILHTLTKEIDLDFFILFSSTTALLGSNGLGHYAAANHFLDGFAYYRQNLGLPALSINWGTWDKMRVASTEEQQRVGEFGLQQMPSEQTLKVFGQLLSSGLSNSVVAAVDWNRLKAAYEIKRSRPFLTHVSSPEKQNKQTSSKKENGKDSAFLQKYRGTRPADRAEVLTSFLRTEVAKVLELKADQLPDLQQGLFEMGLDSLMAIELKNHLEAGIGQSLPSTLIFNYPSIADLSAYLHTRLSEHPENSKPAPPKLEQTAPISANKITDLTDNLSEDELAVLLMNKLKEIE